MMVSTVAIVGRPNVGKSTLFNRLVGRRTALVADEPGLTRDRHYQLMQWEERKLLLVDTGGFEGKSAQGLEALIREQTELAIEEADVVLLVTDARQGLTALDEELVAQLRRSEKRVIHVANKVDGPQWQSFEAELFRLGAATVCSVSAEHGLGIDPLIDELIQILPPHPATEPSMPLAAQEAADQAIRVAFVGRPNAGKSALLNRLAGTQRAIVSDIAGTTRDPIDCTLHTNAGNFIIVDTAGIRRKRRVASHMEQLAVLRAERSIEQADVVALLIDSHEGISVQDAKIASYAIEAGRGLVLVFSKSDLATETVQQLRRRLKQGIAEHLGFASFAPFLLLSAKSGAHVEALLPLLRRVYDAAGRRIGTAELNRFIGEAVTAHAPPTSRGRAVRVLFAAQTAVRPPTFVFSVSDPEAVPASYRRYLLNRLRETFRFEGVALRLIFRARRRRS